MSLRFSLSCFFFNFNFEGGEEIKEREEMGREEDYEEEEEEEDDDDKDIGSGWRSCWRRDIVEMFPPPVPMYHNPVVFDRSYEDDGRLVIRLIKDDRDVIPHKFFRVDRKNGKVSLKTIHMNDRRYLDCEEDHKEVESYETTMFFDDEDVDNTDNDDDENDRVSFSDIHLQSLPISISSSSFLLSPAREESEDSAFSKKEKVTEKSDIVGNTFGLPKFSMKTLSSSMPESTMTGDDHQSSQTSSLFIPPPPSPLSHLV